MIGSINRDGGEHESGNVLEMLIRGQRSEKLNTDELRNNVIAMVLASHETTQVSLGGVLYFLAKYPGLQEKIRKESIALFPDFEHAFANMDSGKKRTVPMRSYAIFILLETSFLKV
nr:cytochrome P450 [Pantoea sp. 18069]